MTSSIQKIHTLMSKLSCLRIVHQTLDTQCRRYSDVHTVKKTKLRSTRPQTKYFHDYRQVTVVGGSGGNGCVSFHTAFALEWGGPDGGDGGNGGHVIFLADSNSKDLGSVESNLRGDAGDVGRGKNCHGKNAEHTYVKVPIGTIVKDEENRFQVDLSQEQQMYVAARGGAGGKGNHYFLSNQERAPVIAEKGAKGENRKLQLELRVMAHASLIGFPNAGKSTLLRAISRARPKVAAYPFTTLHPSIGMVEYEDHEQIAVADIPGLIKGAHENRGLGISFLRHIERCTCLLYVIDLAAEKPWTQLDDLKYELEQYRPGLSERPHAIIGNKIDVEGAAERLKELQEHVVLPVFSISAKELINIDPFLRHLRLLYDQDKGNTEL
ncbi:mitochondrial ribosome-associated GTPase 2-like isoform X2 [Lineus longissimus]